MINRKALHERHSKGERQSLNPADVFAEYYSQLTAEDFDTALEEAEQAGDYNHLYGLTSHYNGEVLSASLDRLVAAITKEETDQLTGHRQLQILHRLEEKWQSELTPDQMEIMADALIDRGEAADIYQSVNKEKFQFTTNQFDRIIAKFANNHRLHHMLINHYKHTIKPEHLDTILIKAVKAKQTKTPEALNKLEEDYRISLWAWDMSCPNNEPKPEPPTDTEKEQHVENVCRDVHELMQAIAENGFIELPPTSIDLLISEGDRSGDIVRALAVERGSQLSQLQRQAIRTQLGSAELLTCLVSNDSEESDWISTEIDHILEFEPRRILAAIANKQVIAHFDPEDIDQFIKRASLDGFSKPELKLSLLSHPQKLSDEQFYAVFQDCMSAGWYKEHSGFFSPERIDRFIAEGPEHLVIALARRGVADSDEQLVAILERFGGRPELIDCCEHLFSDDHINELIERTYHGIDGITKLIRGQPARFSTGQLCKIIRKSYQQPYNTDKLQEECVGQLARRIDLLLEEGSAEDLELILDRSPGMFSAEQAPQLLQKVNSGRACWQLVSRFAKDLNAEQLGDLIDGIHAKLQTQDENNGEAWDIEASVDLIISEHGDLGQSHLEKFMDNLRPSTARSLISRRSADLSAEQLAKIAKDYSHIFEPRL